MKFLFSLVLFLISVDVIAVCGSFGNGGDGCAESVTGIWTIGPKIELDLAGVNWYTGHVCTGKTRVQFSGDPDLTNKVLSIALTSYTASKGPLYFRCSAVIETHYCSCSVITLGHTLRD